MKKFIERSKLCKAFRKKGFRRGTALMLSSALILGTISWDDVLVSAADEADVTSDDAFVIQDIIPDDNAPSDEEVEGYLDELSLEGNIGEIEDLRTTDSTTYEMPGDMLCTEFYAESVRFEDEEGNLTDYDTTLVKIDEDDSVSDGDRDIEDYAYENAAGDMKNYFPENISEDTPVLMENEDYAITVSPDEELQDAKTVKEDVTDIYGDTEKKNVSVVYESEDSSCEYEYVSLKNGVKENIVLNEIPQSNIWKFNISLEGGIEAVKDQNCEGVTFFKDCEGSKEKGRDIVGGIQIPFMNDATCNNYSEAITYDLEEVTDTDNSKNDNCRNYILTMTVDENYLTDENTVYPVTIDPAYTWFRPANTDDVYVANLDKHKDTCFYNSNSGTIAVGKSTGYGVVRTYISFTDDVAKKLNGQSVESAKLILYEISTCKKDVNVQVYKTKEKYNKEKITWNNRPGYTGLMDTGVSKGKQGSAMTLDVTAYAKGLAKGNEDYGLMVKAEDESMADKYGRFFSSKNSNPDNSSYLPKLSVTYYPVPATPTSLELDKRFIKKGEAVKATWAGISSQSLKGVQYRLASYDSVNKCEKEVITAFSNSTIIGNTASGNATISEVKNLDEGMYKLNVRGLDNNGFAGTSKAITFKVDSTAPTLDSISLTPSTSTSSYSYEAPTVKWSGAKDEYLSEVQYRVGTTGSYTKMGSSASGSYKLPEGLFGDTGVYTIYVRCVDKSGNVSNVLSKKYYYRNYVSEIASYDAKNLTVRKLASGKHKLNWERRYTGSLPSDITYEVYQSSDSSCPVTEANLVASGIKDCSYNVSVPTIGPKFYYRVRAVRKNKNNTTTNGTASAVVGCFAWSSSLGVRTGIKDYLSYEDFATPTGTGYVEKSNGNFVYTENDVELKSPVLPIGVARYYNSNDKTGGMFGNWRTGYDSRLEVINSNLIAYTDGTGAVYSFKKLDDGTYECEYKSEKVLSVVSENQTKQITCNDVLYTIKADCYYELRDKEDTCYYFDHEGDLTYIEESNGTYHIIEYNEYKAIKAVYASNGQRLVFNYDVVSCSEGTPRVSYINIPDGSSLNYSYDNGKLTCVTYKAGNNSQGEAGNSATETITYRYTYNSSGMLHEIYDALNNKYTVDYNSLKVSDVVYPDGEKVLFTYNDSTNTTVTKSCAPNGSTLSNEKLVYDNGYGKALSLTDEYGNKVDYTYESADSVFKTSSKMTVYYSTIENGVIVDKTKNIKEEASFNEDDNISGQTDSAGNTIEYIYGEGDNSNLVMSTVSKDANKKVVSEVYYTYDVEGNVTSMYEAVTRTGSVMSYDDDGNVIAEKEYRDVEKSDITAIVNNGGIVPASLEAKLSSKEVMAATSEYDENGDETDSEGTSGTVESSETTEYDAIGNVTYTKDDTGLETWHTYDGFGRLVNTKYKVTDKKSGKVLKEYTESFKYDLNGSKIKEVAKDGSITLYEYDNMNRVVKETYNKDNQTRVLKYEYSYMNTPIYIYDGKKTSDDYKGIEYNNVYVETTKLVKEDGDYIIAQKFYDAKEQLIREKSSGLYTDYTYDKEGRVVTAYSIGNSYDDLSQGKLTLSLYDENGNNYSNVINPYYENGHFVIDDENSAYTLSEYDDTGKVTSSTDAMGNVTKYSYDDCGRLTSVSFDYNKTSGNSQFESLMDYKHDVAVGDYFETTGTDSYGNKSITKTNAAGQVLSVTDEGNDGKNIVVRYEYDKDGNQTYTYYADNSCSRNVYDEELRLSRVEMFDSSRNRVAYSAYEYDINDHVTKKVDYKKTSSGDKAYRYTFYTYDEYDRQSGFSEVDMTDGNGNVISQSEPSESLIAANMIKYSYDIEDKLVAIIYPEKMTPVKKLCYTYNPDRWLTGMSMVVATADGDHEYPVREYAYHNDGKISSIKDYVSPITGSPQYTLKTYEYDVFDRVTSMSYTDSISGSVKESYEYTYDKNDNILSEKIYNAYPSDAADRVNELRTHTYDNLDRLVSTKIKNLDNNSVSDISYTYDKNGNRLTQNKDGEVTTYTYNGLDQLVSSVTKDKTGKITSKKTYSYDAKGNQTKINDTVTKEVINCTYDVAGQLVSYTSTKDGQVQVTQTNEYNGEGRRISKTDNGVTTKYYYQDDEVLYTTDGNGNINCFNIVGDSDNYTGTIRYNTGKPVYYSYNKDIKGSVSNVITGVYGTNTNSTNNTITALTSVVSYDYDDFGNTTIKGNTEFYNEICFTDAIYDVSTGLYYMNARYYNPETGRFISQDSYRGEETDYGTWNLYAYCANNPIKYVDPSGHFFKKIKSFAKKSANKAKSMAKRTVSLAKKAGKKAVSAGKSFVKHPIKTLKKGWKNKNVRKIMIGSAIIGACGIATLATGGACAGVAGAIAYGAFKGSATAAITSAALEGAIGIAKNESDSQIFSRMSSGFLSGSITGAIFGGIGGKIKGPQCFVAGTKVLSAKGHVNIEDIQAGDYVWATNPETGETALKKVVRTFVNETDTLVHVKTNDEEITTTLEHPFYVDGKGWTGAGELKEGDKLTLITGERVSVQSVVVERCRKPVKIYNFEVEDFHTYYVGHESVLVHNMCASSVKLSAGKNFKDHFIRKKKLLERVTGVKYPKFKSHGSLFLDDISKLINNGTFKYVGRGTLKKGESVCNIYRGAGLTVATKLNGEWVTLLKSGEGMDLAIKFITG